MLVNIVGWLLNTSIVVLIIASVKGHGLLFRTPSCTRHRMAPWLTRRQARVRALASNGAQLVAAAAVVVFWNFFANRLWTFKH